MVKELTPTSGAHRAAGRILDVLEHLAQGGQTLTLADLSHRLGVPKSSMLPLLRTLVARGCLDLPCTRDASAVTAFCTYRRVGTSLKGICLGITIIRSS